MQNDSNTASKAVEMSAVRWSKVFNSWQMKTTCSSLACCLGLMLLLCRLSNHTEVSSPSLSCTLSHTGHTVLSDVCYALCFSSLIGFHECIWPLGEIQGMCFTTSQICLLVIVITNVSYFQCPSNQLFFYASMTSGPDVEPTLDLPRA